ncbi:arabinogalactan-protein, putative [Schistosoma mansoni]|uniref:arabinogalactan-protein, putative n=1 Tax=Schistosoma mansoni TaxID=6183 RepID=UPI0001A63AE2|nr:arabinogalactan-protein, putative [Schistosoma mansoni]|eukprot:XP_018646343.1 arabinogalactan-protein, putative [Schistosoma mansoni]
MDKQFILTLFNTFIFELDTKKCFGILKKSSQNVKFTTKSENALCFCTFFELKSYISDNGQNPDYVTVVLPKFKGQIEKKSEYVTQLKQRTTFNTDGDDDNSGKHSINNRGYEDLFRRPDLNDFSSNDDYENNGDQSDVREKNQDYSESGYIDEETTKYEKQTQKQSGTSQVFKHIPKNSITKYAEIDRPRSFNNKEVLNNDAFASKDYSNTDLSQLFDKYAEDTDRNSNAKFDLKNYDVDMDKLFRENIKTSKGENIYYGDEVQSNHQKENHRMNNNNRRMDSLPNRKRPPTLQQYKNIYEVRKREKLNYHIIFWPDDIVYNAQRYSTEYLDEDLSKLIYRAFYALKYRLSSSDYSLNSYLQSYQYHTYSQRPYSKKNYLIIPGIDKFKTIESETLKHIKEFTEITTEHKKYDNVLPLSNFDGDHIDNDKSQLELNKFIDPNQESGTDYNFDLSNGNKPIETLSNGNLNETNNQKQANNSDMLLHKYSYKEQNKIAANNKKPYLSKKVETHSNEEFLYNRQLIKSRQSSRYIILRPRKKKKLY